jgi:hypothetical protein
MDGLSIDFEILPFTTFNFLVKGLDGKGGR